MVLQWLKQTTAAASGAGHVQGGTMGSTSKEVLLQGARSRAATNERACPLGHSTNCSNVGCLRSTRLRHRTSL
jgi:hypothetical protein